MPVREAVCFKRNVREWRSSGEIQEIGKIQEIKGNDEGVRK